MTPNLLSESLTTLIRIRNKNSVPFTSTATAERVRRETHAIADAVIRLVNDKLMEEGKDG